MSTYDSDDALPHSPGLQPIKFRSTPSPSPPPFPAQNTAAVVTQSVSPTSPHNSRRRKRPNRTRPTQGDTVLISFLDPNRPDIARAAGERALNSDSGSELSESEGDEMQDPTEQHLRSTALEASKLLSNHAASTMDKKLPTRVTTAEVRPQQEDTGMDGVAPTPAENEHPTTKANEKFSAQVPAATGLPTPSNNDTTPATIYPEEDSLATSPSLRDHTIPPPKDSQDTILPALHPTSPSRDGNSASSPNQSLPPFSHISELAEAANHESQQAHARDNGFPHRSSISSTGGPPNLSPTLVSRVSLKHSSPPQYQLNPLSPVGSHYNETSPHASDPLLPFKTLSPPSSGVPHHYSFSSYRRLSQASETSGHAPTPYGGPPPPASLTSASTTDSYANGSIDGYSPNAPPPTVGSGLPGSRSMSIGELTQQNTPGMGSGGHGISPPMISPAGMTSPGGVPLGHLSSSGIGFKCDHPGCNAPPFQTQYLLNSHANVHSQSRPHYCPVPGCSRAEGGKGFKRKNEMIRHGLVHDSPGYVCPFCPDRDHKYPRPDNLQRHVRVHHIDKHKDDPRLREVLAQRPEGGGRGRRRRLGS